MGLANYSELKESVIKWSFRDDLDLLIDDFITLAEEAMFDNPVQTLRSRSLEVTTSATLDSVTPSRFLALPTGYQSLRQIYIQPANGKAVPLESRTPAALEILSVAGMPRFFTVTTQFEFDRFPDADYPIEIQHMAEFTPLSSTNTTNGVLTNFPGIYLYGCLWVLKNHVNQEVDAQRYFQNFIGSISGANRKTDEGRHGPAPRMQVDGWTP